MSQKPVRCLESSNIVELSLNFPPISSSTILEYHMSKNTLSLIVKAAEFYFSNKPRRDAEYFVKYLNEHVKYLLVSLEGFVSILSRGKVCGTAYLQFEAPGSVTIFRFFRF